MSVFCAAPERRPPPAQSSTGFMKPSSDDEDSGSPSVRVWKKNSSPGPGSLCLEKHQEKERNPVTVTAPESASHRDKAAPAPSRFLNAFHLWH